MDPASRNRVLMLGGALIVIALLLVCGPLEGRFGEGQRATEALPEVSAAPPVPVEPAIDTAAAVDAATQGAATGGAIGESDLASELDAPVEAAPVVPVPAPVPIKVVNETPKSVKKAAPKSPPHVSAKGPDGPPAPILPVVPSPEELAANAAEDFDSSYPDASGGLGDARDRFPPPVDSGPVASRAAMGGRGFSAFALQPCDSPGAGCQNVQPRRRAVPRPAGGGGQR